jgi:type II secretory pathway pseudopilin PulG
VLARAWRRLRSDGGFGLVELMIAMVILNVGLLALAAALSSGANTIRRASRVSSATAIADSQLEVYRALTYDAIGLSAAAIATTDATYRGDAALPGGSTANLVTATCTGVPNECNPSRTQSGPDGGRYRIDTYVVWRTPPGGRPVKLVTVVVRDAVHLAATPWAREASSFDASTGS